jgi:ABC-type microcin C transport system duplicated ATPase subunit YejF
MQDQEERLLGKMQDQENHLVEKMRDMQTELLRAFHDWARSMETRTRVLPLIDERLGILEDRVSKIERGERPLH